MNRPARRRFLSIDDLDGAAREVLSHAVAEGRLIAGAGGYAMQVYGSDRMTADLDVLSDGPLSALTCDRSLSFGGSSCRTSTGIPVDVIVRHDDYQALYDEALAGAQVVEDAPIRIVRPEHLAVIKLAAGRPKDESDLLFLAGVMTADEIDAAREFARRFLGRYGLDDLDSRIAEAAWLVERAKRSRS